MHLGKQQKVAGVQDPDRVPASGLPHGPGPAAVDIRGINQETQVFSVSVLQVK